MNKLLICFSLGSLLSIMVLLFATNYLILPRRYEQIYYEQFGFLYLSFFYLSLLTVSFFGLLVLYFKPEIKKFTTFYYYFTERYQSGYYSFLIVNQLFLIIFCVFGIISPNVFELKYMDQIQHALCQLVQSLIFSVNSYIILKQQPTKNNKLVYFTYSLFYYVTIAIVIITYQFSPIYYQYNPSLNSIGQCASYTLQFIVIFPSHLSLPANIIITASFIRVFYLAINALQYFNSFTWREDLFLILTIIISLVILLLILVKYRYYQFWNSLRIIQQVINEQRIQEVDILRLFSISLTRQQLKEKLTIEQKDESIITPQVKNKEQSQNEDLILNLFKQKQNKSVQERNQLIHSFRSSIIEKKGDELKIDQINFDENVFQIQNEYLEQQEAPSQKIISHSQLSRNQNEQDEYLTRRKCEICKQDIKFKQALIQFPCKDTYHRKCIIKWIKELQVCLFCDKY